MPLNVFEESVFKCLLEFISNGAYSGPSHHLMNATLRELRTVALNNVRKAVTDLKGDNIDPCIVADAWSENGIALLGVLLVYIDQDLNIRELLVRATPMSDISHTAANLCNAVKMAAASVGLGEYEIDEDGKVVKDTVPDYVFSTTTDAASNMRSAVHEFEGAECVIHELSTIMRHMYELVLPLKELDKRIAGVCSHFRHSVLAHSVLAHLQRRHGVRQRKPPGGNATRWMGKPDQSECVDR
uniref:Uncharacterized protein n=1 Tax=Pyramimonas obovata TaxID=1411642 RepID=A0A7S0QUW4_9CHLO|mmetsp:Transcript_11977/g.25158  ORF Transcript_11977/g.25158 Transcript_11977/m.25158 type:complete len:242 (+) Transcript_11977:896-1621(+)